MNYGLHMAENLKSKPYHLRPSVNRQIINDVPQVVWPNMVISIVDIPFSIYSIGTTFYTKIYRHRLIPTRKELFREYQPATEVEDN